ncbi:MAG: carboxypeptidase regulatory-like domain-containing protein [Euryarchaeota archaeon]|nr:carboxypeptidase regulatory-like domain-containing protein [Euryarchaeota archaeon]
MRALQLILLLFGAYVVFAAAATATPIPDNTPAKPTAFVDVYYQYGTLGWPAGKGTLSWAAGAPTDDPGGPTRDATAAFTTSVGWMSRTHTGSDQSLIPADTFTSEPLPATLALNVSRPIMLDLFTTKGSQACPLLDVELRVAGTLLAGQIGGVPIAYGSPAPAQPPGFCAHAYRIHPELDVLAAGSVIELRVVHQRDTDPFKYGLGEGHRSAVWIPFYPPEEAALRAEDTAEAGADEGAGMVAIGALAPLALLVRRRHVPAALVVVLLLGPLAGCLSTGPNLTTAEGEATPTPSGGSATVTILDPGGNATGPGSDGSGTVVGLISDDLGNPVSGAHVALLGSDHFAESDVRGKFEFHNVTAGTYTIRIDRAEFKSFEGGLEVVGGKITRIEVVLALFAAKTSDFRPHRHDYWGDSESIQVLDEDLEFDYRFNPAYGDVVLPDGACVGTSAPLGTTLIYSMCRYNFRLPQEASDATNLVLPGTRDVQVKVTLDPTDPVDRFGLGFHANHDARTQNASLLYPRQSGEPFHIRTNWEMTDVGHQKYSTWTFFLYIPTNAQGEATPSGSLPRATVQGFLRPVHVEISIHKGKVPLEPPHRDFWNGNSTVPVLVNKDQWYAPCFCDFPNKYFTWNSGKTLVPPETRWLEVYLNQSGSSLPIYTWTLLVKPANVLEGSDAYDVGEYRKLQPSNTDPMKRVYRVPVTPEEADPFYALVSNWNWLMDDGSDVLNVDSTEVRFTLTVVAHQGAMP